MSNTKEIAFKISISAKDAENNIKNVTSNIVLLEDNLKQLEAIANDADLGAAQFEQLATEIAKTVKAETILTETSAKAGNSVETLGNDVNQTDEQFKKLEVRIRETRVALQKAEEAGDKLTFDKLKKDLDELEDGLEATKLKSKQLDDVLVDLPGPLGGVGQALKGLDAGFKLLLANPIIAVLAGVVGVLTLLKKSLSSTAEGQETLNRLQGAFGKILGPILATLEKVAVPLFNGLAFVLEKVGQGFSFLAEAVGISSSKINEASINSSEVLKKASEDQIKRNEDAKKAAEDKAKEEEDKAKAEKDRLEKLNAARKAAYEKELARIEAIKKAKQGEINLNENIEQSETELARSTIQAGDDVIENLKLKDAQREEDYQREKKRIEDLLKLEKAGSEEAINLQIQLNNLNADNNIKKIEGLNAVKEEELKIREELLEKDKEANDKQKENFDKQLEDARTLSELKRQITLDANQAEIDSNEGNFDRQRELLDERFLIIQADYEARRQLTADDEAGQLALETEFNANKQLLSDARITIGKKEVQAEQDTYAQIGDILSQASELAGAETNAGKFLAIAAAGIQTGLGVSKALASSPPPLNFASAALVAAAGLKNILKIQNTEVPSGALKRAEGGMIYGPGSSTSDSIPAYLSNGESVINARSTSIFKPLLSAINSVGGGKRFASGGVVGESALSTQSLINEQFLNLSSQQTAPIKTYVVSTDMSSAQQFDRVQRERSTI
jgi:hypothetical protein